MISKNNLDKRICDVEEKATNTQTYREFIEQTKEEFGIESNDLDKCSDEQLVKELEFLDYLWTK